MMTAPYILRLKKGTKGVSFFLSHQLVSEIYSSYSDTESPLDFFEIAQTCTDTKIGNWLTQTATALEQASLPFKEELFIEISEMVVKQQIAINTNFSELNIVKHRTKEELYKAIILAKAYLNDNLDTAFSLDLFSRNIGISKYYLHRLFKEITGKTPLEYLTYIRLKKAIDKLQNSKSSIFEIAIACGFENAPYFSTVFKKHLGLSPSQYRKCI